VDAKSPLPAVAGAAVLAARGESAKAIAETEAVLKSARASGQLLHAAATVFSVSAASEQKSGGGGDAAQQHTQRAAELLAQALAYLDLNYQAVNRILVDPSLAALRQHAKMRELLPVLNQISE
jgi:hypothetical protein